MKKSKSKVFPSPPSGPIDSFLLTTAIGSKARQTIDFLGISRREVLKLYASTIPVSFSTTPELSAMSLHSSMVTARQTAFLSILKDLESRLYQKMWVATFLPFLALPISSSLIMQNLSTCYDICKPYSEALTMLKPQEFNNLPPKLQAMFVEYVRAAAMGDKTRARQLWTTYETELYRESQGMGTQRTYFQDGKEAEMEVCGRLKHETARALLVSLPSEETGDIKDVWLPKSQIKWRLESDGLLIATCPMWLLQEKGISP